ncbi:MAG: electron transport complex subunit RsxC [bacterium]
MKLPSFKGGVHPPHYKSETEKKAIVSCPLPARIILPLSQHIGVPCKPLVKVGEWVRAGQKIGDSESFISAPIHASVSGTVESIAPHPHFTGADIMSITIIPDKEQRISPFQGLTASEKESPEKMRSAIKAAGIVGLGGAAFPTHVKLSPPEDKPIDSLIINACECEPFLTCDHRLLLERVDDLLQGIQFILKIIEAPSAYIGIENNKLDAIQAVQKCITSADMKNVEVVPLETKYPQGCEKQLIKAILDREIPLRKLPSEVGAAVQNPGTVLAIYEAITFGKPLIERVLTVAGPGIKNPQNILARLGTPISHLISFCDGWRDKPPRKIIMGGPMTGFAVSSLEVSVVKGTSGILAFPSHMVPDPDEYLPCVKCGKCASVCPLFLVPSMTGYFAEKERYRDAEEFGVLNCMECGSCAFICPSRRPLIQFIRKAKGHIMAQKKK